jgi:ubiquinone/menaquinone biosynthesis C-methylase UbiE
VSSERDHYTGAAAGWATGAARVYGPLARALVERAPHPLQGCLVLDLGAGTGLASDVLRSSDAHPIALDLSFGMLSWRGEGKPPAVAADVGALPVHDRSVDDVVAAFVLNHLTEPVVALREIARVLRPGGAVLATVYSNDSRSEARDRIDETALAWGMEVPDWYRELKVAAAPLLGSPETMERAVRAAGFVDVHVEETAMEVGVDTVDDLVDYRLGQANYTEFMASLSDDERRAFRHAAVEAARPLMAGPYRPIVVFLTARTPDEPALDDPA